jgi:hypothetical protein
LFSGTPGNSGWYRSGGNETLTFSDATSGIASATYQLNAAPVTPYTVPFAISANGVNTVVATVTDKAGNVTSKTFTVSIDSIAPTVTLNSVPTPSRNNKPTFSGTRGTASGDTSTVTVKIYSGTSTSGTLVQTRSVTASGSTYSVSATTLPDGTYTAQAEQLDAAGNKGVSAPCTFIVSTATSVAITNSTSAVNASNQSSVKATGTAASGATITLTISDGVHSINAGTTTATGGVWSYSGINLSALSDGAITFKATATDLLGNSASTTKSATKAATATQLAFATPPTSTSVGALIPIIVQLTDSTGHPVALSGVTIAVKLSSGSLSGSTMMTTDSTGKATFSTLRIFTAGAYKLTAGALLHGQLVALSSNSFTIS